ncbi:MAG: cytochrome c [Acidobacteria bacterium]|nr:cytochrome c [Pyrinomonadaceae bacterium]MBA3786895.1 cytochrome c [Acidobacteriota bacterium]
MKFLKTFFVLSAFALFITACGETAKNTLNTANNTVVVTNSNANAITKPTVAFDEFASAREIYTTSCSKCHKEDGTGGKIEIEGKTLNAENLTTDKIKKMTDAKYIDYIENGIPDEGMPAFKGKLTDGEIKDVVIYIRKELQKK